MKLMQKKNYMKQEDITYITNKILKNGYSKLK